MPEDGTEEMLAANSERGLAMLFEEIGEGIRKSNTQQGKKNSLSERDGSIYFKRKENSGMNRTLPIWCDTIKYKQTSFLMTFSTSRCSS